MRHVIPNDPDRVAAWVGRQLQVQFSAHTAIGLEEGGDLLAGVVYEGYNGSNIMMHVAASPGRRWMTRTFLHFAFWYPFEQLGCARVTGLVPDDNLQAAAFDEHLGFTLEATLREAHPTGDLLVYRMFRRDCRWLNMKVKYEQPVQETRPASYA